ncbi:RNA ligase [Alkalilimnicola ehrlichii]|uniref:RNA ligase n=2 Tax=Alkalilimnicola ehrlichii TaxID=351052 RepID=A0A3E0WJD0_9GAMM|nr:RNA ligase [Alkalilimnicola ehrlichii]RFA33082.1 RNA ligase [Alkalilimnicola ehrlichii]
MTRIKRYPVAPQPEQFQAALAARAAERRSEDGYVFYRLRTDFHGMPRGAVMMEGHVVPAYPSVARVFALAAGVRQAFREPFYAEEKIDGYNVRIFRVGEALVPVTRSGVVCPFTRDRLPDLLDTQALNSLFDAHPDLVLCAEVAGKGNPYMPTLIDRWGEDVQLFCFDLMRFGEQRFLPVAERRTVLERYDIPQTPLLGRYSRDDLTPLGEALLRLDSEGAEGAVLKPPADGLRVKYVTPSINLTDIVSDAALELELPGEFFTHRIVRMVMALRELGQRARLDGLAGELGEALIQGFNQALDDVEHGERVGRTFRVRLRHASSCDALLAHLGYRSSTIDVVEQSRRWDGSHYELTFRKIFRKSSDRLRTLLGGGPVFD